MSFIVKGFEMPETCGECPMLHEDLDHGEFTGEMYCALTGEKDSCYAWADEPDPEEPNPNYPKFPGCPLESGEEDERKIITWYHPSGFKFIKPQIFVCASGTDE